MIGDEIGALRLTSRNIAGLNYSRSWSHLKYSVRTLMEIKLQHFPESRTSDRECFEFNVNKTLAIKCEKKKKTKSERFSNIVIDSAIDQVEQNMNAAYMTPSRLTSASVFKF